MPRATELDDIVRSWRLQRDSPFATTRYRQGYAQRYQRRSALPFQHRGSTAV